MPWLGLGVFQMQDGPEVKNAVTAALELGYRSIDTAAGYRNEQGVGEAVRESPVPRDEIFITTKLANGDHDRAMEAFEESLDRLGMDYVDLYLIHWPVTGKFQKSWKVLEEIHASGRAKAIGVSNFQIHHLEELKQDSAMTPMVNQVEFHPFLTQEPLREYCQSEDIQIEAWSPLGQGQLLDNAVLQDMAEKYGKTPAQILLRWDLQHQAVTIPKSVKRHRMQENADVFDFELSAADMQSLDALNKDHRFGPDPDTFV